MVWFQVLKSLIVAHRQVHWRRRQQLVDGLPVVERRAIFGLHEPARRGDAKDVQVVLDAAADEPAVAVERLSVCAPTGTPAKRAKQRSCPTNANRSNRHSRRTERSAPPE